MLRLARNKFPKWGLKNNRAVATFKENETKNIDVPSNADVVIIGGGSAGCNALYHLGKRGVNAVLLEKSKLISGTTWHTAGLLWLLRGICDIETELLKASRLLYASLQEETGINPGWISNGGLCIAHSAERVADYERLITSCKNFDIEAYMIDPIEAKEKFPLLDKNAFQAAIYSPADGTIDPVMLVNALTKSAERNGCKVLLYPFSSSPSSVSDRSKEEEVSREDVSSKSIRSTEQEIARCIHNIKILIDVISSDSSKTILCYYDDDKKHSAT